MDTTQNTPLGFGAIEREQSPTDFNIGTVTPTDAIPSSYMPSYGIFIENQGQQPACGAHAGYEVAAIYKSVERGSVFHGSPKYVWDHCKMIDGYAIEDGTDMPTILKVLSKNGICDISLMPNAVQTTLSAYADASNITPEMDADAMNNRIDPIYAFGWSPTMDALKAAIYHHKAVILLVRIGDEFWLPSWSEKDILPLKSTRPITSGHFITAYAYDENYIYFYNHWSAQWGRAGTGYFAENYLSRVIEYGTSVNLAGKFTFKNDLKPGMTSTEVGILQVVLRNLGFFPKTQKVTSFFGPITIAAVEAFQAHYASEVLTPAGVSAPTGNVLQYTRAKLNQLLSA